MSKTKTNAQPQAAELFTIFAADMLIRMAELQATDVSTFSIDDRKKHENSIKNHKGRADRANAFAALLGNDKAREAWDMGGLTVQGVTAMAIYAQDKVHDILSAFARGVALSSVTQNHSTRAVLSILAKSTSHVRSNELACDVAKATAKPFSTASTQTSSTLAALRAFGYVEQDMMSKGYALTDAGKLAGEMLAA